MVNLFEERTGACMNDYSLSLQYGLVGLDGMDSLYLNTAKRAVLRAVEMARVLEPFLAEEKEAGEISAASLETALEQGIQRVKNLKKAELTAVEKETAGCLIADGTMEMGPDILGCDINYETAGLELKIYRSDRDAYLRITEEIRAEVLEDGPLSLDALCMLWLLRESGCIHELFSVKEQGLAAGRVREQLEKEPVFSLIWKSEFHSGLENFAISVLKGKANLFKNPYLEGVNLLFPFLERRQAIFIDQVIFGTTVQNRRLAVAEHLSQRGHYVEEVKNGTETLLRVDNHFYRLFPRTVQVARVPVQGIQLVPVYW